jgi:hypothetical protein
MLNLPTDLTTYKIYRIIDNDIAQGLSAIELTEAQKSELAGNLCYTFYSCCNKDTYRFQFIFKKSVITENNITTTTVYDNFTKDSNRIILDTECQYYIDNIINWSQSNEGFEYPTGCTIPLHENSDEAEIRNNTSISVQYRGRKYVYTQESVFHTGLNQYV